MANPNDKDTVQFGADFDSIPIPSNSINNAQKIVEQDFTDFGGNFRTPGINANAIEETTAANRVFVDDSEYQANNYLTGNQIDDYSDFGDLPDLYNISPNISQAKKTIKANGGATKSQTSTAQKGVFNQNINNITINPRNNVLNGFASYTYNIELYMLELNTYIRMLKAPREFASLPKTLLMRSGGLGPDTSPDADIDFYIQDLSFENVAVSPNVLTSNTNSTDIKMTIIEPRGTTLLERLRTIAGRSSVKDQHFIHVPYIIRILFKGYDVNGTASNKIIPPIHIPMRITDFTFDVDNEGAQYVVKGVPFHQNLQTKASSTIPINLQLKATNVNDVFKGKVTLVESDQESQIGEEQAFIGEDQASTKEFVGLGDALTEHYKSLTLPKEKIVKGKDGKLSKEIVPGDHELYDEYRFNFAQELANSKLDRDAFNPENSPQKQKGKQSQFDSYRDNYKKVANIDKETQLFRINNGTDIAKLINGVLINSDYIPSNITEEINQNQGNKPIKWFKIKPKIEEVKGWDKKVGRYKFKTRYDITPQAIFYNDYPWAPNSKPNGIGVHKIYNYTYTGLNVDVLDFRFKFNTSFMQVMTIGTGNIANKLPLGIFAPQINNVPQPSEGAINSSQNTKQQRAKDLFSTVMYQGVDLVNLDLTIIGDPAYLPTADGYWMDKEYKNQMYTTPFMPDGTINYDLTPPYVQVNLKTPIDYDETTGLAVPGNNGKYTGSEFSGVYQVTNIKSTFSGGVFEQTLSGLRTKMQPVQQGVARDLYSAQYNSQFNAQGKDSLLSTIFRNILKNNPTSPSVSTSNNVVNTISGIVTDTLNNNNSTEISQSNNVDTRTVTVDDTEVLVNGNVDRFNNKDVDPIDWIVG